MQPVTLSMNFKVSVVCRINIMDRVESEGAHGNWRA